MTSPPSREENQKSTEHFLRAETEKVYHDNRKLSFVSDESTKSGGDTKGLGFFKI